MAEKTLYNANDGIAGRDGGPYLDHIEMEQAEIQRAKVEGREPDLDNPPAAAGTQLVTARQVFENAGANYPSGLDSESKDEVAEVALAAVVKDKKNNLSVHSVQVVDAPVDEKPALKATSNKTTSK